jgi:hypothetical protein
MSLESFFLSCGMVQTKTQVITDPFILAHAGLVSNPAYEKNPLFEVVNRDNFPRLPRA